MNGAFLCREKELKTLEDFYRRDGFQMLVIYGRRRIGKSTLIREFIKGKRAVFYTAVKSTLEKNVELLGNSILGELAPGLPPMKFPGFTDALRFLAQASKDERLVFVIDEIPYLAEADSGILSELQAVIDEQLQIGNMFLILCGSSVSFMEDKILSEKSPVFGRRTGQLELKPFSYLDSAAFVPGYSPEDKAIVYGVTGGVAKYLSLFDDSVSVEDNIVRLFFSKSGYLYEEPDNLLTQEFRNVSIYNAIIEAIASGKNKVIEIADDTHIDQTRISHALKNLMQTGIVRQERAVTEETNRKKLLYCLNDNMFRFWYSFVPDGMAMIELDQGDKYFSDSVLPYISDYMSGIFEDMCRYYTLLLSANGDLPVLFTNVGKWWGTDPAEKNETDIDIVAVNKKKKAALVGECKYKNRKTELSVMEILRSRSELLSGKFRVVSYLLFSKAGFTEPLIREADEAGVKLITLEEMYG